VQLEDDYEHFTALSLFFIVAKFYASCCRHIKVTANDKVERFWGTVSL